jgi:RNA polymerase sigma factor (sigma-70 family)
MVTVQPPLNTLPDAEVLTRFLQGRDDGAFAELVRRHGPLVRAACWRVLGESHDADDAFQAVFWILARKAGTVRDGALLGPWLHRVAVRAAERARLLARRRQARERPVTAMPEPSYEPPEPRDWLPLLDAEIQRLPDRLRVPLVLCELQGKSRAEVSRLLGLNEGTLSSRLARGRDLLRRRLRRTGTIVAGAGLTTAFAYGTEAPPPQLLIDATTTALTGATSASVAALTQGVLKAMLFAKLKFALTVVLAMTAVSGVLLAARQSELLSGEVQERNAGKPGKDRLQGRWEIVSVHEDGKEPQGDEAERIKMHKFVFKGDKLTAKGEHSYSIDTGKKPMHFNLIVEEGPEAERGTWQGIYELKEDRLTLCLALPNRARPTVFESTEGEHTILMKLKRAN